MKLVLYILALVAIGGAIFSSMNNIDMHQKQLDDTKAMENKVRIKKKEVEDMEAKFQSEEGFRVEAKKANNTLLADKDLREQDVRNFTKQSAGYDDDLNDLNAKKEKIQKVIAEIEKELEGQKIPLEEVESYVTNLENKKKDINKTNVALMDEIDVFTKAVKKNNSVLTDFKDAQLKRRNNLDANKVSSLITAVDNEWGFVVVKPHTNSMITQDSKLLVIRGSKHIGRLNINAIEGEAGRVLANIVYSSIAPGMRIRPGDRVILSKPLTK